MSLLHRTYLLHILLIMSVAGTALYAQVSQAPAAAPFAVPTDGAVRPAAAAPTSPTPLATTQPGVGLGYSSLVGDFANAGPLAESVLVVPGKPMDPQAVGQTVEDLSIMSRIIEKNALGEYRSSGGAGSVNGFVWGSYMMGSSPASFFPSIGRAKPMYLGGYGALFFIRVDYPLLPPPATPQEPQTSQQEDPVWAQAKRDIVEPQADAVLPQNAGEPPEPYSREMVDTLRTQLIAAMKHATNIRALEPGEWVAFVAQGPGATDSGRTAMTLRATKADVDQYAKGRLNQQQFEQRLQIVTY